MKYTLGIMAILLAWPLAAQEIRPTEGYLAKFSRKVSAATRAQVALNVEFPQGVKLEACPVTFGVPFPRGALRAAENVRLLEGGKEVTCSIQRTATWERPDGDVKWLLVDAAVKPGQSYALEFGTDVRRAEVKSDLRVEDGRDAVTVTTGPLRFVVSRTSPGLLHAAWLDRNRDGKPADDEVVIAPGTNPAPFMVDDEGTLFVLGGTGRGKDSAPTTEDYAVTVEQAGPLHAIVKVDGWYRSAQGVKLCQFIARLHAYAGQGLIRVEHTFVVAFDTDATRLRDIAIPFKLAGETRFLRENGFLGVWGLEGDATRQVKGGAYLVQDAVNHFSLRGADGAELASGKRAAGWVDLSGPQGGLTVGLRHLWQEYPRELEVKDGAIVAHLWPVHHERPLDFDAKALLGPELYKEWGDKVYWQDWYKGGLDQYDQAFGLAKSNDLMLVFHGPDQGTGAALCRTLDEPVIVAATPEWMCRSDVMGPLHPRDRQRFADVERKLDAGMTRFEWLREHLGNFGLIHYGDVNYHAELDNEKKTWQWRPWRCWASRFYGHPVMPWVEFLRTGERRFLHWGIANARHVMDIDMCHMTNEKVGSYKFPKYRGGRFGGNGGIIHYAADIYDLGCDSHVDHLLLQYYLTGYRRAWDVLMEEAEFYLWKDTRPGGTLHGWGHRMTGGALRVMTALYQATWDERYLKLAQRMADFCYQNQDEEGVIRHDDVYMAPGLVTYYQATGDERMKDLFLRCMKFQAKAGRTEGDPRSFGFYGLSMAYFMTGDPAFLRWAERWKQDYVRCVTEGDDPFWFGHPKGQWDYCYLTLHLLYMPYYLEAAATLDKPVQSIVLDNAVTSGEILLLRESDKPFNLTAEWFCYSRTHYTGVGFNRMDRYLARRPSSARVVLRGPSGAEVMATPIFAKPEKVARKDLPQDARFTPEAPGVSTEDRRTGKVLLSVPTGAPGVYRLAIEDQGDLHFKLRLSSSELHKWAYATQDEYLACAEAYFLCPTAEKFDLSFKTLALRKTVDFTVVDPSGQTRKKQQVDLGAGAPANYTTWSFEVEPAHRNKLWRFCVDPPNPQVEQTYLKFQGALPVVWTSAEAFFPLDASALRPPKRPEPVAEPYQGAGKALRIEAGKPLVIPRGEKLSDGRYKSLDARQGTLEFWFRAEWPRDDISDHTIASCGQMRLYRRSSLGTYLGLGGTRQSGFITEPGRWYHLAITWDAGGPGREPKTGLFINGLDLTGQMLSAAKEPLGDWTADKLILGGDVAFTIDDLRISDVVRYEKDSPIPAALSTDPHTLLLNPF